MIEKETDERTEADDVVVLRAAVYHVVPRPSVIPDPPDEPWRLRSTSWTSFISATATRKPKLRQHARGQAGT